MHFPTVAARKKVLLDLIKRPLLHFIYTLAGKKTTPHGSSK
jgi:hypothetical protein